MTDQGVRLGAAERRLQLLGAARETFGTKGYTATSMNDIATAAGVTKPVLYQHFESKRELFLELLTNTASELTEAIQSSVESASTGREELENAIAAAVSFFGDTPANYQVIYGEGVRTEPDFANVHRSLIDSMHEFTAAHIDIDTLGASHRHLLATAIAGQLEGVIGQWIELGQTQTADEVTELLSSLIWRGLRGTS